MRRSEKCDTTAESSQKEEAENLERTERVSNAVLEACAAFLSGIVRLYRNLSNGEVLECRLGDDLEAEEIPICIALERHPFEERTRIDAESLVRIMERNAENQAIDEGEQGNGDEFPYAHAALQRRREGDEAIPQYELCAFGDLLERRGDRRRFVLTIGMEIDDDIRSLEKGKCHRTLHV